METDEQEGFSAKKVVTGAALGVAVPAAVAVAKRFVGGNGDDGDDANQQDDGSARDEPISRERKQTPRSSTQKTKPKPKPRTTAKRTRTREQLYKQATRLKIEGRSSMNKEQLERAVNRAKAKASR